MDVEVLFASLKSIVEVKDRFFLIFQFFTFMRSFIFLFLIIRRHLLKTYKQCFIGKEAVEAMLEVFWDVCALEKSCENEICCLFFWTKNSLQKKRMGWHQMKLKLFSLGIN